MLLESDPYTIFCLRSCLKSVDCLVYQRDGTDSHGGIRDLRIGFLGITQTGLDSSKGN